MGISTLGKEIILIQLQTLLKDAPRWKNYTHKNVVPFLGLVQNVNGQYPSVVMRLFKNGNALDYVKAHPQLEKLRLVRLKTQNTLFQPI